MTQRDLVWNALRMRPDRIIVGEVRGAEAFDMLQAMNTGHDGSISTVHANSARDALTRIENMVQMGHVNLPSRAIRMQIVGALDLIVQVERMRDGQRRIMQITEVIGMEGETITTNDIALSSSSRRMPRDDIRGTYTSTQAIPKFISRLAYFGLDRAWAETMREVVRCNSHYRHACSGTVRGKRVVLILDARQRRIDRHVLKVLPIAQSSGPPSARRRQVESRWQFLYNLVGYRARLAYDWGPGYVITAGGLAAAAVFYGNTFLELPVSYVAPAAIIAGIMVMRGLFGWQRRRLANRLLRQLPDAIELVTSTLRSGLPAEQNIEVIARDMPQPTAGQFATACNDMALGRSADEALDGIYQRTGVPEFGMFGDFAVQAKAGGRLTETLQTLGDTVRGRVALAARAKALAGETIFSARALSVSPVLVGGLLYSIVLKQLTCCFPIRSEGSSWGMRSPRSSSRYW